MQNKNGIMNYIIPFFNINFILNKLIYKYARYFQNALQIKKLYYKIG